MQLVELDREHPGFKDPLYRRRRNAIARLADRYRSGEPIPRLRYEPAETGVWTQVLGRLADLYPEHVCGRLIELQREFPLSREDIPQLADVSARLVPRTGFRMEPVSGLVPPRLFFRALSRGGFLSTQYVRHPSRPLYTPEPDVIHELVGHAATLAHPGIAALNQAFGHAACKASPAELERLERVYWYTLEFGVVEERGQPRAFGAGLLSSVGELSGFTQARLRPFDLEAMATRPYDPSAMQPELFVAPGFESLLSALDAWFASGAWRDAWGAPAAQRVR